MSNSTYYGPDEPEATIQLERNFMAGDCVSGVGFGLQVALYARCALFLWSRRKHNRQSLFLLGYITLMLAISTMYLVVQALTVQMIYIDNRNYPGGPWTFFLATQTATVNVMFYATLFLLTFLSDLLVLWRCWVIWSASGRTVVAWAVTAFPTIILLASFALGTLWTLESSQPNLSLYSKLPMAFGTAYYAISLGANIILTLLIIGRLAAYRRQLLENFPAEQAKHYISLATVIVESAALYSIFAALFLFTYAANNPTNQVWLATASSCQQIANLLIIYRVAEGSAWRKDTLTGTTKSQSIQFGTGPRTGTTASRTRTTFQLGTHAELEETSDLGPESQSKEGRTETV